MKALFLGLVVLVPTFALAVFTPAPPQSASVTASSNNIPTAFSQAAGSKVLTLISASRIRVSNQTGTKISFVTSSDCSNSPSSTSSSRLRVEAGEISSRDDIVLYSCLYLQSEGSAITTGTVDVEVW